MSWIQSQTDLARQVKDQFRQNLEGLYDRSFGNLIQIIIKDKCAMCFASATFLSHRLNSPFFGLLVR